MSDEEKRDAYHHGDLRAALIEAAVGLVDEGGVQNLSLRKVAKRAGVSPAAPYHHFKNRAALMAAVAEDGFRKLGEHVTQLDEMAMAGEAYVRFAVENPGHFRVMFRPELADAEEFPALAEASSPVFEILVQMVQEAQREGRVPPGDHEPYVMLAWSVTHGLAALMLDGPMGCAGWNKISIPVEQVARVVLETFEAALRDATLLRTTGHETDPD